MMSESCSDSSPHKGVEVQRAVQSPDRLEAELQILKRSRAAALKEEKEKTLWDASLWLHSHGARQDGREGSEGRREGKTYVHRKENITWGERKAVG